MRLKNSIDYKRLPEPSRGDWTRFTILVLSAKRAPRHWEPFFVQFHRTVVTPNRTICLFGEFSSPQIYIWIGVTVIDIDRVPFLWIRFVGKRVSGNSGVFNTIDSEDVINLIIPMGNPVDVSPCHLMFCRQFLPILFDFGALRIDRETHDQEQKEQAQPVSRGALPYKLTSPGFIRINFLSHYGPIISVAPFSAF